MAYRIPVVKWLFFHLLVVLGSPAWSIRAQISGAPVQVLESDRASPPRVNRVLQLTGANAWFDVPVGILGELTSSLTVAGWVRPQSTNWAGFLEIRDGARLGVQVGLEPGVGLISAEHFIGVGTLTTEVDPLQVWNSVPPDRWTHFAITYEGTNKSVYVNGGLLWRGGHLPLAVNLRDGASFRFGTAPFAGELDDLCVWSVALGGAEIQQLIQTGGPVRENSLLGLWKFDDPAKPAEDSGPRRNRGGLGGSASTAPAQLPSSIPQLIPLSMRPVDEAGSPLPWAELIAHQNSAELIRARSIATADGFLFLGLQPDAQPGQIALLFTNRSAWLTDYSRLTNLQAHPVVLRTDTFRGQTVAVDGSPLNAVLVEAVAVDSTDVEEAPGLIREMYHPPFRISSVPHFEPALRPVRAELSPNLDIRYGPSVNLLRSAAEPLQFACRWSGRVSVPVDEVYTFHLASDDGSKLFVDERLTLDHDGLHGSTEKTASVELSAGIHQLRVDYFEAGVGSSALRLFWSSPKLPKEIIPPAAFTHLRPKKMGTNVVASSWSDERGQFEFVHLRPGRYQIRAHTLDGLVYFQDGKVLEVAPGRPFHNVEIRLQPFKKGTWRTFTTEHGLPNNVVGGIVEGADGSLWLGTDAGIFNFDGLKFKEVFGLHGERYPFVAYGLRPAGNGTIAFGPGTNVTVLDPRSARAGPAGTLVLDVMQMSISSGGSAPMEKSFPPGDDVAWRPEGDSLLRNSGGIRRTDGKTQVRITMQDGVPSRTVRGVEPSSNGVVWVQNITGISRYDEETWKHFTTRDGLPGNFLLGVKRSPDNSLWMSFAEGGVAKYDGTNFIAHSDPEEVPVGFVRAIQAGADGVMWFGSLKGLLRHDPAKPPGSPGRWRLFGDADGLDDETVCDFKRIADDDMWLLTPSHLVHYDGTRFKKVFRGEGFDPHTSQLWISSAGNIWFASGFRVSSPFQLRAGTVTQWTSKTGLDNDLVRSLYADSDSSVWMASLRGVFRFNSQTQKSEWFEVAGGGSLTGVASIFRDSKGRVWFGTHTGLAGFDGGAWTILDRRDGYPGGEVYAIEEGVDGALWLATDNGLVRFRPTVRALPAPQLDLRSGAAENGQNGPRSFMAGERVEIGCRIVDLMTVAAKRQLRYRVEDTEHREASTNWTTISGADFPWQTNRPGEYRVTVQYIDRDLNYSAPARVLLAVVPLWYQNPRVMIPLGVANAGLLIWAFVARALVVRRKREAEALRGRVLDQEQKARISAEESALALAAKNTQLEAARKEADAANEAKSCFLANMSHELRTPLNAILGYTDMVREELEGTDKAGLVPDLDKVTSAAKHQLGLVNDILDLSKIEAGKMTLFLEDFDPAKLIDDVAATVKPLVEKNGNTLLVEKNGLGTLRADQTKLRQILLNLLSNASKFTTQGTITLRAQLHPAHALFEVSDTGIGMTPEQLSRLFQAFSQADASTSKKYGGTGLGLALSRKFAELMGGSLTVSSQHNQGSTFTINLPSQVIHPPAAVA